MAIKSKLKKKPQIQRLEVVKSGGKGEKTSDPCAMPNTYKFAAEALKTMSERGGSAGSIVVHQYKSFNFKLIYALVMNTVKNIKIIKKIIHNVKLASQVSESNPFMLEILVGDLLFGRGLKAVRQNPTAAAILARQDAISKEQNILKKEFVSDNSASAAKYLRINHLKTDMSHVITQLKSVGLTQLEYSKDKIKFKKFINKFKSMDDQEFMLDFHFPYDLILLKQKGADKLKKLDLLTKNKVTYQDKASFMAVEALEPLPMQKIIDACFAPGCKTSLIATKMKNKGKILAYDVDKQRLVSAIRFLKLQGATCVKTELSDFSKVKLRRLPKIHGIDSFDSIIIDPSCSGSGIKSRVDYKKTFEEIGRLKKLQAFQVSLLRHALRACVSRSIIYCTCSTSVEENEQVVEMALKESGEDKNWKVEEVLPYWPQRGEASFDFGSKCVRSDANSLTNGFFIAKLVCSQLYVTPQDGTVENKLKQRVKSKRSTKEGSDTKEASDEEEDIESESGLASDGEQVSDDDDEEEEEQEEDDDDDDDLDSEEEEDDDDNDEDIEEEEEVEDDDDDDV